MPIVSFMEHCGAITPLSLSQRSPLMHSIPPITKYYYGAVARTPTPAYTYTVQSTHLHTHRVLAPRRRWAAGTVTLRMRNRNMRGPIKTGQGNIVTCVHPKVQTATLLPLAVLMTNVRTDGHTQEN